VGREERQARNSARKETRPTGPLRVRWLERAAEYSDAPFPDDGEAA
jgi:hypothetical protein